MDSERSAVNCAPRVFPGNGSSSSSESEEDPGAGAAGSPALPSTHRAPDAKLHPGHAKMDAIKKGHAKESQRYKVAYEAQSTDTQNFSSESERETEHVRAGLRPRGGGRGRGGGGGGRPIALQSGPRGRPAYGGGSCHRPPPPTGQGPDSALPGAGGGDLTGPRSNTAGGPVWSAAGLQAEERHSHRWASFCPPGLGGLCPRDQALSGDTREMAPWLAPSWGGDS